jgi:lipooligosaccharide transport system permease protein
MVPQRTYEALLATPIEVDDIVVGELLWCATKSTIAGCAILIVAVFLGAVSDLSALLSIPLLFVIGFCFGALAMIVTALANGYEFFSYYITLVITPMFILCGVFYPTTTLPEGMQQVIQFLPLTHAVALVRPLVTGQELIAPFQHLLVLIAFGAVGTGLTIILIRRRLII